MEKKLGDKKEGEKKMDKYERELARRYQKQQEMLKTPAGRAAHEYMQRKASEKKKREEILKRFEAGYIPPLPQAEPKKSAEQMYLEEALKNFM